MSALGSGGPRALKIGFMPLNDCALPVIAATGGFAQAEGLSLTLVRETSWANTRDRVMIGHFDAAHMLAPLPIAASLGLGHFAVPMVAPMSLGQGGNAITLASAVFDEMQALTGVPLGAPPAEMGKAIAAMVAARAQRGAPPLTIAVVHPFSCHNYELRYWMAASGVDPDRDIRIVGLPPPFMVDALRENHVDGIAVGDPWGSLAVEEGVGVIVAVKATLWRQGPEKVLGLRADFARQRPDELAALVRALERASRFAADPANHADIAALLSRPEHVGAPAHVIHRALTGEILLRKGAPPVAYPDFLDFRGHAATFPWRSQGLWVYAHMVRWGQAAYTPDALSRADAIWRPDLYRAALAGRDVDIPLADSKIEGALAVPTTVPSSRGGLTLGPDGFFDGRPFDPSGVAAYLHGFAPAG